MLFTDPPLQINLLRSRQLIPGINKHRSQLPVQMDHAGIENLTLKEGLLQVKWLRNGERSSICTEASSCNST